MFCGRENKQHYLTGFITECYGFVVLLFYAIENLSRKIKYNDLFLNPKNINVPKKTLTGFYMVRLACLSQKYYAGYAGTLR